MDRAWRGTAPLETPRGVIWETGGRDQTHTKLIGRSRRSRVIELIIYYLGAPSPTPRAAEKRPAGAGRGGAARDARSLALRIGSYILSGSALRRVPPDGD